MTIDRLFELDLQSQDVQKSNIFINQGNVNSFRFIFKIVNGSKELEINQFVKTRLTLSQGNSMFYSDELDNNLEIIPKASAFGRTGRIIGQIDLEFADGNLSTLHFDFNVVRSLDKLSRADEKIFISGIQGIIDELNEIVSEAQRILGGLQSGAFATEEFVLSQIKKIAPFQGEIVGNDINTTFTIVHNKNTLTPIVLIFDTATNAQFNPTINIINNSEIQIAFLHPLKAGRKLTVTVQ